MKILLADDERIARTMLERSLRGWGYEVVSVTDGEAALAALRGDPDLRLGILDWVMPKVDGLEVCRAIRADGSEPYRYLMLLTARDDKAHIVEGLEAGADDYLTKPCDPVELKVRLRAGRRVVELQSELIRAREALRFEATHDSLTGLMNRAALLPQLERELSRSRRSSGHVAVIMGDIDHFKRVNDTHGHFIGDIVLREVAQRLARSIRTYDTVGRLGGEEFLVVLPDCDAGTGTVVAERLRLAVASKAVRGDDLEIPVTMSFGVASTDLNESASAADLIRAADAALYRAKFAGRDRVVRAERSDWRASPLPESSAASLAQPRVLPDTEPEPANERKSTG
jgi:diguanylate cyclase (GGDEF)-like protein